MAKALYGHIGGIDPHVQYELVSLRRRVRDLEDQLTRVNRENDALHATIAEQLEPEKLLEHVAH